MTQDTRPRDDSVRVHGGDSFLPVDGASLRYRDEGQGQPVIFIHGWTLDLDMWEPQVAALSGAFRIIRHDRRGFGLSSGNPSLAHDLADLRTLCRHLRLRQVAMVGMSQGARVALEFARSFPAALSCLVLDGPPQMGAAGIRDIPLTDYRALACREGIDAFRREWTRHPLTRLNTQDRRAHEILSRMIGRYPGNDLLQAPGESMLAPAPWLPSAMRVPALVIGGELDLASRQAAAAELASRLPSAQRATIPNAGHLCNLDNPSAYNEAIRDFLARQAGPYRR
ncbi:MAG TPA: alpha/beta hydrolase [Steroidobacteraceae bacterium]|jgi:pimeloyl-ACP methyl ester carboxylesterase|nr:alpha/beta hydrolase [Steroidobacteraceae bacterium]